MGEIVLQDPERGLRYVFINEADVYRKPNGEQVSYVTVIDTNNDTVRVPLLTRRRSPHLTFCHLLSPSVTFSEASLNDGWFRVSFSCRDVAMLSQQQVLYLLEGFACFSKATSY